MIKYTEFGWLEDESTEEIDIIAYYADDSAMCEHKDTISIAVTKRENLVEITSGKGVVLYSTYAESGLEIDRIINVVDAVLGVTDHRTNIDD